MNEQQQELNERIADDERHAATMRKARDYDALAARLEVLESAFDNSHQLNEQLGDENRALLARVAELEATLVSNSELDSEPFNTLGRVIAERNRLTARVADLEARAEAAERERDDANIEAALNQANAREAWARVAELEAALTGDIQAVVAKQRNPARS